MRPYLSLIVDSFREAFASRVLWIALVLIAITLLALAPIGYEPVLSTRFTGDDIWSIRRLVNQLAGRPGAEPAPAAAALFAALDNSDQQRLRAAARGEEVPRPRELSLMLNDLVEREDEWYDAGKWENVLRLRELRELDAAADAELTDQQRDRRARLRIEAALPGSLSARRTQSVVLSYAWLDVPEPLPLSPERFRELIEGIILPLILDFFLGVLAVFIAILVTAPIIPSMFHSGALQLLLSKPINRSMLFLTKYLGGCAFIIMCATPLVIGAWAILGMRLDIWNHRLLLAIPLFSFLFAFYYSVSAVAGLVWRNTIVCIAVTILFWLSCFLFTVFHGFLYTFTALPNQAIRIMAVDDDVHLVGTRGRWKSVSPEGTWRELDRGAGVLAPPVSVYGPVRLGKERVALATIEGRGFQIGGGSPALKVSLPPAEAGEEETASGAELPAGTRSIHTVGSDDCLAVTRDGLYRIAGEAAIDRPVQDEAVAGFSNLLNLFGLNSSEGFRQVSPDEVIFDRSMSVGVSQTDELVAIYARGTLYQLQWQPSEQTYVVTRTTELGTESNAPSATAVAAGSIAIIQRDEPIRYVRFDSDEVQERELPGDFTPRGIAGDPHSDRFAVRSGGGDVYVLDAAANQFVAPPLASQGEVHACCWNGEGQLWTAYDTDHLLLSEVESGQTLQRRAPELGGWRFAMHYVIDPLYSIAPKPSDLGETMQGLIFENEVAALNPGDQSLESVVIPLDPWAPVISCGAFMLIMLLLGCVYISRQDF